MTVKRVHVFVTGRVQGVFFRAECAREARSRGVAGFVRNVPDGRVEAAFEGPVQAVDDLVAWCHRGTEWSRVDGVEVAEETPRGEGAFDVRR